jgi:hypothetical protein
MMVKSYSLIQPEIGPVIDRQALEEASVVAPSVGKADCMRISRELFGIVVGGIPIEDAIAFRAALMARNFPTLIAADQDIPRLPEARFFNRIDANDEAFILTDALGRKEIFRADNVLLLAAGFLQRLRNKTEARDVHVPYGKRSGSFEDDTPGIEYRSTLVQTPEFRLECFIKRKPYRLCLMLDAHTNFIWNNVVLRVEKPDPIHAFLKTWHRYVPEDKWNLGLQRSGTDFQYPSPRAFENEIRWHFYMLKQRALK